MRTLTRIITALLFLLVFIGGYSFVQMNFESVNLWIFKDFAPRPLGQWLLLSFLFGGLLGLLAGLRIYWHFRQKFKVKMLESRLRKASDENHLLRTNHVTEQAE